MEVTNFENKKIRRVWQDNRWFFSVVDVVRALTESIDSKDYWYKLKVREQEASGIELSTFCRQLKLTADDGKQRETDCADTEGIFRIIQSIPSKKAEPFKRWLARVGYERVQEIENPELAQERMKSIYEKKGYSKEWIDKRLRGIAIRQNLTDEWKNRGIKEQQEFAILTNEIAKATFGVSVEEHKKVKEIDRENLRDNMTDLELIFSMLGEASTTEITKEKNPEGLGESLIIAKLGGDVAGKARKDLEKKTGKKVVTNKKPLSEESIKIAELKEEGVIKNEIKK
jgi:prophage antirepressor-like protein